jgi:hypothetical protein
LVLKRQSGDGQDDGPGLPCLPCKFVRCTGAYASAKAGEENHKFSGVQQLMGEGAEASHALFCQGGQRSTSDAVKGVSKAQHVNVLAGREARIVGVDEDQVSASATFHVRLFRPRATDASDSSHEDVGGVHDDN